MSVSRAVSRGIPLAFSFLLLLVAGGCDLLEPKNDTPNVPAMIEGRPVEVLGEVAVSNSNVTFRVWDSGQIDGDIISLMVNGKWVVRNLTLTGSKQSYSVQLNKRGYSYVALYAHNVGSIPPNTAALSIDDGVSEKNLVLSANLQTNGAYNIVVR